LFLYLIIILFNYVIIFLNFFFLNGDFNDLCDSVVEKGYRSLLATESAHLYFWRQFDCSTFERLHHEWERFICDALNEKWQREDKEPKRWIYGFKKVEGINGIIYQTHYYQCPVCKIKRLCAFKFCTDCGQRLLPPEEKDENEN